VFPDRWKKAKNIPIRKSGMQNRKDVNKYRKISLLNVWWKMLEKVFINRINHQTFSKDYSNKNQYGFIPQTRTIDAISAVKECVQEGFAKGEITVTISLGVEGEFYSSCVPTVLKKFKRKRLPTKLI